MTSTIFRHTIFHTPLCHTPSFTHNFVTRSLSHTIFTRTIFHIFLCHRPSFTYNFVTHTTLFYFSVLHHLLCLSFLPRPRYNIWCSLLEEVGCLVGLSSPLISLFLCFFDSLFLCFFDFLVLCFFVCLWLLLLLLLTEIYRLVTGPSWWRRTLLKIAIEKLN